jgi:D-alanyl-lipoteichoic acid acyltransferase DltB (MBOAT superfamily)
LYIPLGGSRGTAAQTRRNLLITMVLGGLWHGAAWTFVLWGVYQGVLLVIYRPYAAAIESWRGVRRVAAWFVMFHLTCAGWLIFRAASLRDLVTLTGTLITHFALATVDTVLVASLGLYVMPLLVIHLIEARADDVLIVPRLPVAVRYFVYSATLYLILLFGNFGGAEFIYFQF